MHGRRRTTKEIVTEALARRAGGFLPLSIADTVNRVRTAMPACDLADDELCDLIVIAALEHGLCITFDRDLLETDKAREPVPA